MEAPPTLLQAQNVGGGSTRRLSVTSVTGKKLIALPEPPLPSLRLGVLALRFSCPACP